MQKKAVIYIRMSTKKEALDVRLGIEAQRNACTKYCIRENILIIKTFEEIVSGCVDFNKRLVFPKVIEECTKNQALLVVAVQDRLTRSLSDWDGFNTGRIFGRRTPKLICVDSPNSSELEGDIRALFAQYERRRISERTKQALAVKKSLGYVNGQAGRDAAIANARRETEEAINLAMGLRQEKMSYQNIANILNAKGYTTSRGTPWSAHAVMFRLRTLIQ